MKKTSKATENSIGKALYVMTFIIFALGGVYVFLGIYNESLGLTEVLSAAISVLMSGSIPLGLSEIIKLISRKTE